MNKALSLGRALLISEITGCTIIERGHRNMVIEFPHQRECAGRFLIVGARLPGSIRHMFAGGLSPPV